MTQEFEAIADQSLLKPLPPDWIRVWDNPGGRHYFYNTADHDIQWDLVYFQAKTALKTAKLNEEEKENNPNFPKKKTLLPFLILLVPTTRRPPSVLLLLHQGTTRKVLHQLESNEPLSVALLT
jgi:hypothetical protein